MNVFHEIPCLTEQSSFQKGLKLQKTWFKRADKRIIGQYLQKFVAYNSGSFKFLGVEPRITGTDQNSSIFYRSTCYIGAVPLRSPDTGKQIGDFVVSPRFNGLDRHEEYVELLELLGSSINPEFTESIPLISGRNFRPPIYLEAIKYINYLYTLIKKGWRKFDNRFLIDSEPAGVVNWSKYVDREFKVENRLTYPTRKNYLREDHLEFRQLKFVYEICAQELSSYKTPARIRNQFKSKLNFIEENLYTFESEKIVQFKIRNFDSPSVQKCKESANIILSKSQVHSTAWRVDIAEVFEKYVQFLLKLAAKEHGAKVMENYRISALRNKSYSWELRNLEPDAIYSKRDLEIFIDAKYKSNLYNKFGESAFLKEEHRSDLHQILAYSSFSKSSNKIGLLVYPSFQFELKASKFNSRFNSVNNQIYIVGIPMSKQFMNTSVKGLLDLFRNLEKTIPNN